MNRQQKEQFLIENYSKMTNKELAKHLGYRNASTVGTVASRLGLKKFYKVDDLPGEQWSTHPDFPDFLVSSKGRVKSKLRNRLISTRIHEGYYDCRVNDKNGRKRSPRIHRLVAEIFVANPYGNDIVNHVDGDKTNNDADNLEWTTNAGNLKHAHQLKLVGTRTGTIDERHVIEICKLLQDGKSINDITSKDMRYTRSIVEKIRQRQRWTKISGDYYW